MAITIPIFADFNDKGLRDAEGAFEKFGSKVAGIAKVAATAVAGIGLAGLGVAKKAIDAASDLEESQAKIGQIFGETTNFQKGIAHHACSSHHGFGDQYPISRSRTHSVQEAIYQRQQQPRFAPCPGYVAQ